MKILFKRLLQFLLFVFIVIQFFRPTKNVSSAQSINDISTKYAVPANVMTTLKVSCYDCHSNNTAYPWYNNIQPVAWWLANHVDEGKREINFNEFAAYSPRRQYKKFREINEQLEEDEMPLESYTIIHGNAKLSRVQKIEIYTWANAMMDSMKVKYPIDSLERKKKV
jgi:Haem-binding domain